MKEYPLYIRATVILFFFTLAFAILYFAKDFFVPICLAALLSILLLPFAQLLENKLRMHRLLANFIIIVLVLLVIGGFIWVLYSQVMSFMDEIPKLQQQVDKKLIDIQQFVRQKTGLSPYRQIVWMQSQLQSFLSTSGATIRDTVYSTTSTLATIGMVLFYIFFFLFYREKFKNFIIKVTPEESHAKLQTILTSMRAVIQSYISGVFIVVIIMSLCICSGLVIIGVPFAIFLGVMTGLLNIIPYIGVFIGALVACIIAFLTKDSSIYVLGTFIVFLTTHLLESNVFTPAIVGRKVSVNPLAIFIALVIGSQVWGIMGMILFIPLIGIIKVICDNIAYLQPFGYLLGTEGTGEHTLTVSKVIKMIRKKKKK